MNLKFSIVLIKIFVARPVSQQGDSGPEQLPTLWLRSYDYDAVSVARFGVGSPLWGRCCIRSNEADR